MKVIRKKKHDKKVLLHFAFDFLLVLLLPFTLYLVKQTVDIRQLAFETAGIYVVASAQKATAGQTFILDVYVNAGNVPVNVVQTNLFYPQEKLDVIGIETSSSPFNVESEYIVRDGLIRIGREAKIPVTGINRVVAIRFTTLKDVEYTQIQPLPGSLVLRSTDQKNILGSQISITPQFPRELILSPPEKPLWYKALGAISSLVEKILPF